MNMDAQMAADLVAMMEPVTKWSTMVLDPASLLRVIRRALRSPRHRPWVWSMCVSLRTSWMPRYGRCFPNADPLNQGRTG